MSLNSSAVFDTTVEGKADEWHGHGVNVSRMDVHGGLPCML